MSRVEPAGTEETGPFERLIQWFAQQRVGQVPTPMRTAAHNRWILRGYSSYEYALDKACSLDPRIKALASLRVASRIGCPF